MDWVDNLLKSSQRYNHEHDDRGGDTGTMDNHSSKKHSRSKSEGNYQVKYSSALPTSHQGIYKESFSITPSLEIDQQDHDVKQLTMVYSLSTPQLSLEQLFMNIDPDWHSAAKASSSDVCNDEASTPPNHGTNKKRQSQSPDVSEQARSKIKRHDNLEETAADIRLAVDSPSIEGQMNSNTQSDERNNDKDNFTTNEDANAVAEEDPFKDKLLAAMALLKKRKISKTPQQVSDNSKKEFLFKMYTYDVQKDSDGFHICSVYCDSVVIGRATGKNPLSTQRQAFKVALVNVCKCCPKESVYLEKNMFMPPICPREKDWSTNLRKKKIFDLFMLFDICMKERGLPYTSDTQEDFDRSYKCSVFSDFVCICCANENNRTKALRTACGGAIELIIKKLPQEGTPKIFTEKVVAQIRPSPNSLLNRTKNDSMARIPSLLDLTPSPIRPGKSAGQQPSPFRIDFMCNQLQSPSTDGNKGNFNTYNPFIDKFILFEECISKQLDAFSVLQKSARFSFVQLIPKFDGQNTYTEATSCTLMVEGEFLAEASGSTKQEAQNNVSSLALKKLKTFRPTIRVKESNYISGTIVTHMELFGEENEFEEDEIPCYGNEDYEEPKHQHFHVFNHHNLRDFRNEIVYGVFTPVVEKFVTNLWLDELAFDFEFTNSERFVIHQICRSFNLNSVSQGRENNRFLVMSRRRNAQELLADLIKLGGSTSKYELIKPQAESMK